MPLKRLPGIHSGLQAGQLLSAGAPLEAPVDAEAEFMAKVMDGLKSTRPTPAHVMELINELVHSTANSTGNVLHNELMGEDLPGPRQPKTDLHDVLTQRMMHSMGEKAPDPYHDYTDQQFQRASGQSKGKGFLGVFPVTHNADPGITSEYSLGDDTTGQDYPSLVPTLNAPELNKTLNSIEGYGGKLPESVENKALQHALLRRQQGKSTFAQDGEQNTNILPYFQRIK